MKIKPKIEQHIAEIAATRTELRPTLIVLPPTERSWKVIYRGINDKDSDTITETSTTLEVPAKAEDIFWVPNMLQQWLHEKALEYLPKHLDNVSNQLNLSYNKVTIKRQKTRWGSCSIKRNINLNRNLMLMPFEVVDYVLYHELVHLKILSHSSEFWRELNRLCPNYRRGLTQLKYFENSRIPEWALA